MVKKRHENQATLAKKKGRVAVDEFLVNDRVVIQNHLNGKWEEEGKILACRRADDQSVQSFEVQMDSGTVKIRNKRFIKHLTKEDTHGQRHVQFQPSDSPAAQLDNRPADQHDIRGGQEGQSQADSERAENGPLTRSRARSQ